MTAVCGLVFLFFSFRFSCGLVADDVSELLGKRERRGVSVVSVISADLWRDKRVVIHFWGSYAEQLVIGGMTLSKIY